MLESDLEMYSKPVDPPSLYCEARKQAASRDGEARLAKVSMAMTKLGQK
jgi:hypothetical protein